MSINDYITYWDDKAEIMTFKGTIVTKNITFLDNSHIYFTKNKYSVAILGIPDFENETSFNCALLLRDSLYKLVEISKSLKIIDLGNIKCGNNFNDTCINISKVVIEMNKLNITVIILGGSSKFHWGFILANQKNNIPVNLVSIDAEINPDIFAPSYINDFADHNDRPSLYNFTNIGFQSYLVERKTVDMIDDLHFEAYRLGNLRTNIDEMEPVLRDSNLLNFSLNAVKYSDSPGSAVNYPNGLTGDEACQLSFFAGHSNYISAFGLYDLNHKQDPLSISSKLGAQIIWYFLEGFANRIFEEPDITSENFTKYIIHNSKTNMNLSFYKSNLTGRWWMEITNEKLKRNILISCSDTDYQQACRQEIPERWWLACLRQNKMI